jgi:undecaprenyl diphosphate synthase
MAIQSRVADPLPRHVAIIMDGNGRWAQSQGMPRIEGHRRGVSTVRMVSEASTELNIEALTLYCLSSENWKRPATEIEFLMQLLHQYLIEERRLIMDQGLRLKVIGRRDRLPTEVIEEMERTIELSAGNPGTQLVLAIDYGGRDEIVRATRSLAEDYSSGKIPLDQITEENLGGRLFTAGLPEVDLMIRTGGDHRISNFLLWQLSYAEIWITDVAWPEFERQHFDQALHDFAGRTRRFGGLA